MLRRLAASVVLLALCAGAEPAHRQASKQKSPDKARVAQIQQALVEQHYMPAPTGKWDAETIEASRSSRKTTAGRPATCPTHAPSKRSGWVRIPPG